MKKREGIHFYINIKNYDLVIEEEETKTGNIQHSIHALDTYFSMVERYAKNLTNEVVIEKITGSRLHMYLINDNIEESFNYLWKIAVYARSLSKFLREQVGKYKSLKKFQIQVGSCYGEFYEFEFNKNKIDELTTIGYAANFAAKLQSYTDLDCLSISENMYQMLRKDSIKNQFRKIETSKIAKYNQKCYYQIPLRETDKHFNELMYTKAIEYANSLNLGDIQFSDARKLLSFDDLSVKTCKRVIGIPFFSDIRNFTCQFEEDDSNLKEMVDKTIHLLNMMYDVVVQNGGVHVQFQGDREVALFHNYVDTTCSKNAVIAGLKLINQVKEYRVSIGIGQAFGKVFATKIGARGNKDNLLLGKIVSEADYLEDEKAGENQLCISSDLYLILSTEDRDLAGIFIKKEDYYYTTVGFNEYRNILERKQLKTNTKKNNYNGAWRN